MKIIRSRVVYFCSLIVTGVFLLCGQPSEIFAARKRPNLRIDIVKPQIDTAEQYVIPEDKVCPPQKGDKLIIIGGYPLRFENVGQLRPISTQGCRSTTWTDGSYVYKMQRRSPMIREFRAIKLLSAMNQDYMIRVPGLELILPLEFTLYDVVANVVGRFNLSDMATNEAFGSFDDKDLSDDTACHSAALLDIAIMWRIPKANGVRFDEFLEHTLQEEQFDLLEDVFHKLGLVLAQLHTSPQPIVHGDCNFGNIFYCQETEAFSLIDFEFSSFDPEKFIYDISKVSSILLNIKVAQLGNDVQFRYGLICSFLGGYLSLSENRLLLAGTHVTLWLYLEVAQHCTPEKSDGFTSLVEDLLKLNPAPQVGTMTTSAIEYGSKLLTVEEQVLETTC